jgi:cytochrome c-type biogenesis protein
VIDGLFEILTKAVESTPVIALSAAAAWGVLSILLSPCHLTSIPLVIGFISEQGRIRTSRAFWLALLFSLGILAIIGSIGAVTALLGRITGDLGPIGNYAVAIVFFAVGAHFLGIMPIPWSGFGGAGVKRRGFLAAFLLGLIFGIALGPCTFAFMAPVLGVTFRVANTNPGYAVALLVVYGLGHCAVIVVAGTFTQTVQRYLHWTERSRGPVIARRVCGVLVILGGVYLLWVT